ncbi:AMP-binding protein [Streptomyces sp. ISL-14]|nr:AMP-binding protein [Streptomyces sp. ISL-14]
MALLLTESALASATDGFTGTRVLLDEEREAVAECPADAPPRHSDPAALAYVIYTSGSTGTPKGVMVTHGGLANHLAWAAEELTSGGDEGAPLLSSTAFDLPATNVYVPLMTGGPVHVLPADLDLTGLGQTLADVDLEGEWPVRARLYRLGDDEHLFEVAGGELDEVERPWGVCEPAL